MARATTGQTRHEGDELDLAEGHWLLNPGSVGQPRDGNPRAAWMLLDTEAWTASYRRVEYDIEGAAWAIRAARLPGRAGRTAELRAVAAITALTGEFSAVFTGPVAKVEPGWGSQQGHC